MVTWGQNTVHTFEKPAAGAAPASGFSFGAPGAAAAPAAGGGLFGAKPPAGAPSGGLFGSTPAPGTSLFGAPATSPAPSLFGSSPAPAPSLFGAAPSPGGLFGSTPAPAPLFGAPSSGSLFGAAPAPSLFGAAPAAATTTPQQQIPAQAALQAHMDASARQEAERVQAALAKLYEAYTGVVTTAPSAAVDPSKNYKFASIVYNELTQEQRQLQWLYGMSGGTTIPVPPPKPPQIREEDWNQAVVRNPDPMSFMPIPLLGADSLNARVAWQQDRATQLNKDTASVKRTLETVEEFCQTRNRRLQQIKQTHANQRKRLLHVMRKVEVFRCMNQQIQADEVKVMERLRDANKHTQTVQNTLVSLRDRPSEPDPTSALVKRCKQDIPDTTQLTEVLQGHRQELTELADVVKKDLRDLSLIRERVVSKQRALPVSR